MANLANCVLVANILLANNSFLEIPNYFSCTRGTRLLTSVEQLNHFICT